MWVCECARGSLGTITIFTNVRNLTLRVFISKTTDGRYETSDPACSDYVSFTWTQVNHPRRRRSDFVRNGFQRGPQTVVGAQDARGRRDRGRDDDGTRHEYPRADERPRDVPTGPIHFPSVCVALVRREDYLFFFFTRSSPNTYTRPARRRLCVVRK